MSENNVSQLVKEDPTAAPERKPLVSVDGARAAMLACMRKLEAEKVPAQGALDRVLAAPLLSTRDQPPFTISQMDGYAVRSMDTPGTLQRVGESAAGRGFAGKLEAGQTIRISTGAALPEGADAVVIQEDVQVQNDAVTVPAARAHDFVRPRAMDFAEGSVLLQKGRRLDAIALALAAAAGVEQLNVVRRPHIAILSGGDELAEPGAVPGRFQIFDSGTHGLAAMVRAWGGNPERLQLEKDDPTAIALAAERGLEESDLLVVIGGASVGDHDHARPALKKLGLTLEVEKINLRPGKPTWFGHTPMGVVLGLPGNPASALVCAQLFLRPMIAAMLGTDVALPMRRAILEEALPANEAREHYLRARLSADTQGRLTVKAFEQQDSSLLSVFAAANALIRMPPKGAAVGVGGLVDVLPLDTSLVM